MRSFLGTLPIRLFLNAIVTIIVLVLSFSAFYGLAFLILIIHGASFIRFSRTFASLFARSFVAFLLLIATSMIISLIAWFLHIPVHPSTIVLSTLVLFYTLLFSTKQNIKTKKLFDRSDALSIATSLIIPLVIAVGYFFPKGTDAASYQLVSNGWDNGWHINMMQNTAKKMGLDYFVSSSVDVRGINSADRFHSYPQAWHFTNALIAEGWGANIFKTYNPLVTLNVYILILVAWMVIASYALSKLSWSLLKIARGTLRPSLLQMVLFVALNLVIQLIVLLGGISGGFPNYLASIAFILILISLLVDREEGEHSSSSLIVASLLGTAAALSWLPPLLALLILIPVAVITKRSFLGRMRPVLKSALTFLIVTVSVLVSISQAIVFLVLTSTNNQDFANDGFIDETFPVSTLLLAVFAATALAFWLRVGRIQRVMVASISSFALLAFALYLYQLSSNGGLSYYFPKTAAILLVIAGAFAIPAFLQWFESLRNRYFRQSLIATVLIGATALSLLIIGSGQLLSNTRVLSQPNSKVNYDVAQKIVNYLKHQDQSKTAVVVLRNVAKDEDKHGYLVGKLANADFTCAYWVNDFRDINIKLKNLDDCANTIDKQLVVVTSNKTKDLVAALHNKNIRIVNVP